MTAFSVFVLGKFFFFFFFLGGGGLLLFVFCCCCGFTSEFSLLIKQNKTKNNIF